MSRVWGLLRKELSLTFISKLSLVSRLFLGPLVSFAISGLLYNGFFSHHPDATLARITRHNYTTYVAQGFLLHTCLHAGYFGFSARLVSESASKTLALIWMAPTSRWLSILMLSTGELLRVAVIASMIVLLAGLPTPADAWHAALFVAWLLALIATSVALGFLRACVFIPFRGTSEVLDQIYLVAVFAACPYIPRDLLPAGLRAFCDLNPLYHFATLGRDLWSGRAVSGYTSVAGLAYALLVLVVVLATWRALKRPVLERSFAG